MGRGTRLAVIAFAIAGCGGGAELTPEERLDVANAEVAFYATIQNGSQYPQTLQGVDDLIRICRAKPDAKYDGTNGEVTMRQVLEDDAAVLERYRGELSDRLAAAAAAGCE